MSDADWATCGEAGGGAYGGDYGRGAHRGGGRHRRNGARELQGQIQQPHAAPGQTKAPTRWAEPIDNQPAHHIPDPD